MLAVLSIVGGDVIHLALAQLSGGFFTPVAFSFGWVAYSFHSLMALVGAQKLMPESDYPAIVVNGRNGYVRANRSWILGRILRDFDFWKPRAVEDEVRRILDEAERADAVHSAELVFHHPPPPRPPRRERAGLCISIFSTAAHPPAGTPTHDLLFYSGIATTVVQLGIAAIPCALWNQWLILMITACGILLALASGALPQWKEEKWMSRRNAKTVVLTEGNGAQHAIVILGRQGALNLEDLASGNTRKKALLYTKILATVLASLWIALLITVSGLNRDSWFLLAVGGLGMAQNVLVAAAPRRPEAFGLHLQFERVIGNRSVMNALKALEDRYPCLGASLVPTFFPGRLREDEKNYWEQKARQQQ